jgi:hypothetical protein
MNLVRLTCQIKILGSHTLRIVMLSCFKGKKLIFFFTVLLHFQNKQKPKQMSENLQ